MNDNEKIIELLHKAGWPEIYNVDSFAKEVAELAVKECINILKIREENMYASVGNTNKHLHADECHIMADYIREQFGIT